MVGFGTESSQVWRVESKWELFCSKVSVSSVLPWGIIDCFLTFNFTDNEWELTNWRKKIRFIIIFLFLFRRLNTLNKCASMKLDVNFQRKKVGVYFLLRVLYPYIKNNINLSKIMKGLTIYIYSLNIPFYNNFWRLSKSVVINPSRGLFVSSSYFALVFIRGFLIKKYKFIILYGNFSEIC